MNRAEQAEEEGATGEVPAVFWVRGNRDGKLEGGTEDGEGRTHVRNRDLRLSTETASSSLGFLTPSSGRSSSIQRRFHWSQREDLHFPQFPMPFANYPSSTLKGACDALRLGSGTLNLPSGLPSPGFPMTTSYSLSNCGLLHSRCHLLGMLFLIISLNFGSQWRSILEKINFMLFTNDMQDGITN